MVKAKDFWMFLCERLDYRFFSGIPCLGLKPLYNKMNSKIMHYIPAINEESAVGIASGMSISGIKSGILMHINSIYKVLDYIVSFNFNYEVPFLLLFYYDDIIDEDISKLLKLYKIPIINLSDNFEKELKFIDNKSIKKTIPSIVLIKGGLLV